MSPSADGHGAASDGMVEVQRIACPGHADGPCDGEVPFFRNGRGYVYAGVCTLAVQRRAVERANAAFGLVNKGVRDEIASKLAITPERYDVGDDPKGRINAGAFDALAQMPNRSGVWMVGEVGSGKSFLGWHTVDRLCREHGQRWVYVTEAMLREAWRVFTRTDGEDPWATSLLRRVGWPTPEHMADGIMFDELGGLRDTSDAADDLLDGIVHTAHAAGTRFIVTSNRAPSALLKARGERAVSRLAEVCGQPFSLRGNWRVDAALHVVSR